jgi:hypothetical protein
MIRVSSELVGTQVESAVSLLQIYVQEASFWEYLEMWVSNTNLSQHDILEKDSDILTHLRCMFNCDLEPVLEGDRLCPRQPCLREQVVPRQDDPASAGRTPRS